MVCANEYERRWSKQRYVAVLLCGKQYNGWVLVCQCKKNVCKLYVVVVYRPCSNRNVDKINSGMS